jgi:hypothetical protein
MRLYVERKQYNKAIEILNESIQMDSSSPRLVRNYRLQLKDIYKSIGDQENYIGQLWALVLSGSSDDLTNYYELKSQYSAAEWLDQREVIFKQLQCKTILPLLYFEEKLYDRLLKVVIGSNGINLLQQYSKVLSKAYSVEILNKYNLEINKMAVPTTDRKRYRHLVDILKEMAKIQGGKEVVDEIASRWRFAYSNRSAMMDELRRL